VPGKDLLDRAAWALLALAAASALLTAVRLGVAARQAGDPLAELRAQAEARVAAEREQIRPILELAETGDRAAALRAAEEALGRLEGNAQLRLFIAGELRAAGREAEALAAYRSAFELSRDIADRHASCYAGGALRGWLDEVRPRVAAGEAGPAARRDLFFIERALAGGCT